MSIVKTGEIVKSLAGHDTGEYYLVAGVNGDSLTLINGRNRNLQKPKAKKIKHVQSIKGVDEQILEKLQSGKLIDADVIHMLRVGKEKKNV